MRNGMCAQFIESMLADLEQLRTLKGWFVDEFTDADENPSKQRTLSPHAAAIVRSLEAHQLPQIERSSSIKTIDELIDRMKSEAGLIAQGKTSENWDH